MAVPDIEVTGLPTLDPRSKGVLTNVKSIRECALENQTQKRSFSRRAEKYQDKRDYILKQSARLFSNQGFANVSLDDVVIGFSNSRAITKRLSPGSSNNFLYFFDCLDPRGVVVVTTMFGVLR
jgi:hypothetical protein